MPTEKPRYTIIVDHDLLKQIDDFRFENRFSSRSAATLELIRLGIEQLHKEQKEQKQAAGVFSDTIRVSVGIENIEDLIEDFVSAVNNL